MTEPPVEPALDDLPATARALLTTLQEQVRTLQRENAALRQQLDVLCQRMFGKKSERVDPRQLQLAIEQLANEPGTVTEPIEMDSGDTPVRRHTRRRPAGRRPLPAHLPRRRSSSTYRMPRNSARVDTPRPASASRSPRSWSINRRASW